MGLIDEQSGRQVWKILTCNGYSQLISCSAPTESVAPVFRLSCIEILSSDSINTWETNINTLQQISKQSWEARGGELTSDKDSLGAESELGVGAPVPLNSVDSLRDVAHHQLFPSAVNVEDAISVRIEAVSDGLIVHNLRLDLSRLEEDLAAFSGSAHLKRELGRVQFPLKLNQFE